MRHFDGVATSGAGYSRADWSTQGDKLGGTQALLRAQTNYLAGNWKFHVAVLRVEHFWSGCGAKTWGHIETLR